LEKKMKKIFILEWAMPISVLLVIVLVLTACNGETPVAEQPLPEQPEASAPPVEEAPEINQPIARWNSVSERGNWVLVGYGDALNPIVVEPGTYVTINFGATDDQVYGSGGCNNYSTTYTADDDFNLTINSPMGSTMMACESGMEQETLFMGALETVNGYNVTEDGHLLLTYDSDAVYDEQLDFIPETALMDTTWVLTAYGDPNDLASSEPGVMTTAIFSADGNLNGNTGCNNYAAGYQIDSMQLSVDLPVMNLMACEKGMGQEAAFLQLLGNVQSYRLGINTLEIMANDGSVLRFSSRHLPLENVRWRLASIDGQAVPEDINANVLFTPANSPAAQSEENAINGNAGCNAFFGAYTLSENTFASGSIGLTQMMCEDAVAQVEQTFLAGLENTQSYQIALNQLIINTETGALLLYADRMPLEGSQWVLTGRGMLDDPQPPIEDSAFTAIFGRQFGMPSGIQSGGTGCNDYTASYYAGADKLKVNLPQTSQYACVDAQMEAEQAYFLGLNTARDYRILGNELQVFFDDQVLIFTGNYPETGPLTIFDGTMWWLTSIDTFVVAPDSETTILFEINEDGRTGRVSGSGGCNTYSAEITDVFIIGTINATAAMCDTPEGIMEQEASYLNVLQNANGVWIEGDTLRITTNMETLYFGSGPVPVQPLPLMAVIEASSEGQVDVLITFDGSGSTSDVEITSYKWDFGDETEPASGAVVEHGYNAAGVYDVTLTITDANGQTATATAQITINE